MRSNPRIIFFDLLRIFAICLILTCHIFINILGIRDGPDIWFGEIFYCGMGIIGVQIFLFVSGAVLELNKPRINSITSYVSFEIHRLLRVYPAYWMSLLFGALLILYSNSTNLGNLFWQFSGFNAFTGNGNWGGLLNPVGWCIGLFVIYYLLYPFISRAINCRPYLSLACLFVISAYSTYYINTHILTGILDAMGVYWFPLDDLFYFGLGIFIVKQSWYPKYTDKAGIISYFGELSFYVFLLHFPLLPIARTAGIPIFLAYVLALSMVAMFVDARLHQYLKLAGQRIDKFFTSREIHLA